MCALPHSTSSRQGGPSRWLFTQSGAITQQSSSRHVLKGFAADRLRSVAAHRPVPTQRPQDVRLRHRLGGRRSMSVTLSPLPRSTPAGSSHPAFHGGRGLRPQIGLRSGQRGRDRERRDCDPPSSLCAVGGAHRPWAQREASLQRIRKVGRREWQKESGYRQQARVENSFFRYKSVFGGDLKARHSKAQRREAAIGCHILNRMAEFGRPSSYALGR